MQLIEAFKQDQQLFLSSWAGKQHHFDPHFSYQKEPFTFIKILWLDLPPLSHTCFLPYLSRSKELEGDSIQSLPSDISSLPCNRRPL
jgi:hypothetical protein